MNNSKYPRSQEVANINGKSGDSSKNLRASEQQFADPEPESNLTALGKYNNNLERESVGVGQNINHLARLANPTQYSAYKRPQVGIILNSQLANPYSQFSGLGGVHAQLLPQHRPRPSSELSNLATQYQIQSLINGTSPYRHDITQNYIPGMTLTQPGASTPSPASFGLDSYNKLNTSLLSNDRSYRPDVEAALQNLSRVQQQYGLNQGISLQGEGNSASPSSFVRDEQNLSSWAKLSLNHGNNNASSKASNRISNNIDNRALSGLFQKRSISQHDTKNPPSENERQFELQSGSIGTNATSAPSFGLFPAQISVKNADANNKLHQFGASTVSYLNGPDLSKESITDANSMRMNIQNSIMNNRLTDKSSRSGKSPFVSSKNQSMIQKAKERRNKENEVIDLTSSDIPNEKGKKKLNASSEKADKVVDKRPSNDSRKRKIIRPNESNSATVMQKDQSTFDPQNNKKTRSIKSQNFSQKQQLSSFSVSQFSNLKAKNVPNGHGISVPLVSHQSKEAQLESQYLDLMSHSHSQMQRDFLQNEQRKRLSNVRNVSLIPVSTTHVNSFNNGRHKYQSKPAPAPASQLNDTQSETSSKLNTIPQTTNSNAQKTDNLDITKNKFGSVKEAVKYATTIVRNEIYHGRWLDCNLFDPDEFMKVKSDVFKNNLDIFLMKKKEHNRKLKKHGKTDPPFETNRAAVSIEKYSQDLILPFLDKAEVESNPNGPRSAFMATLVALREVMMMNPIIFFFDLNGWSRKDKNQSTKPPRSITENEEYIVPFLATSVIFFALERADASLTEELKSEFSNIMSQYDSGAEEFSDQLESFCDKLGHADNGDSEDEIGVLTHIVGSRVENGIDLGELSKEETYSWKISFNRAKEDHPLQRKTILKKRSEATHKETDEHTNSDDISASEVLIPRPTACTTYLIYKDRSKSKE